MFVREAADDGPRERPQPQVARVAWLFIWATIAVTGAILSPTFWLVFPYSVCFWAFTLAEWKCSHSSAPPANSARGRVFRMIASFKRTFRGRRGARVLATIALAAATAAGGTTCASLALVVRIEHHDTKKSYDGGAPAKGSSTAGESKPSQHKSGTASTSTSTHETTTSESAETHCARHVYTEALWASGEINELLDSGAELGPEEEGCVERLNTEYETKDGFVWGVGLSLKIPGEHLSIVVDSYVLHPAIFITPALTDIETLIKHYGLIGGTEKEFPRYSAGSGDFILVNTAEDGTCVLMRRRSGTESEAPAYQLLYPSASVAWATVIKNLRMWQWAIESPVPNAKGERIIYLTAPGATASDATITYNPRTGEAHWGEYAYTSSQRDISPSELEQDVRRYLPRRAASQESPTG